jgi:hypothetical protein
MPWSIRRSGTACRPRQGRKIDAVSALSCRHPRGGQHGAVPVIAVLQPEASLPGRTARQRRRARWRRAFATAWEQPPGFFGRSGVRSFFGLRRGLPSRLGKPSRPSADDSGPGLLPRRVVAQAGLALPAAMTSAAAHAQSWNLTQAAVEAASRRTAGFGWELTDLHNNRAVVSHEIHYPIVIDWVSLDAATMITKPPERAGFCEVLITIDLRERPPELVGPKRDLLKPIANPEIAAGKIHNPSGVRSVSGIVVSTGAISRMILKTWVSPTGIGSSTGRSIQTEPRLLARPGNVVVVFVGHAGVSCDAEIQAVMGYTMA